MNGLAEGEQPNPDGYEDVWVDARAVAEGGAEHVLVWARHGARAAAKLRPWKVIEDLNRTWAPFRSGGSSKQPATVRSLGNLEDSFGEKLGSELLEGDPLALVDAVWRQTRTSARVRLNLTLGHPMLAALPWEMLRVRLSTGGLLPVAISLDDRGSIVRRQEPSGSSALMPDHPESPRIVYVTALGIKDLGLPPLGVDEWAAVNDVLAKAEVELPHHPTSDPVDHSTIRALLSRPCDLFIFSGHGATIAPDRIGLRLGSSPGAAEPATLGADELGAWLSRAGVRIALLNACDTAAPSANLNLAETLTDMGVPTVVAMQAPVSDDHAAAFAVEMIRQLVRGATVDSAVRAGRSAMSDRGYLPQFGIPVLIGSPGVTLVRRHAIGGPAAPARRPLDTTKKRGSAPGYGIVVLRGNLRDDTPFLLLGRGPDISVDVKVQPAATSGIERYLLWPEGEWPFVNERALELVKEFELGPVGLSITSFSAARIAPPGAFLLALHDALAQIVGAPLSAAALARVLGPAVADVPLHPTPTVTDAFTGRPLAWPAAADGLAGMELVPEVQTRHDWLGYVTNPLKQGLGEKELEDFNAAAAAADAPRMITHMQTTTRALSDVRRSVRDLDRPPLDKGYALCRTTRTDGTVVIVGSGDALGHAKHDLGSLGPTRLVNLWGGEG